MINAEILNQLADLGLDGPQFSAVIKIVAKIQSGEDEKKAAHRAAQAKYRNSHKKGDITGISQGDHVPVPPCLDKENPQTPKEIKPNPPLPPNSVGSAPAKRRKPTNGALVYHPDFLLLWREFPFQANASKKDAYTAWLRLPEEDRDKCFDGAISYGQWLEKERQRRSDYPGKHLSTFINSRGFDTLLEIRR